MSWSEFVNLLIGLNADTALGRIVQIRSEKNHERIKNFNESQRRIRNEWIIRRNKKLKEDPEKYETYVKKLQSTFSMAFGGGNK